MFCRYYHNITSNTLLVLEAMAAHNVKTLIYSSTCATYGEPEKMPITEETTQVRTHNRVFCLFYPTSKSQLIHYLNNMSSAKCKYCVNTSSNIQHRIVFYTPTWFSVKVQTLRIYKCTNSGPNQSIWKSQEDGRRHHTGFLQKLRHGGHDLTVGADTIKNHLLCFQIFSLTQHEA